MEGFLAIILVIGGWIIFRMVLSAGARTVGAAAKAAVGKGSFSENMELAFQGMGAMEARIVDTTLGDDEEGAPVKAIEVKGLFPVDTARHVAFVTSMFDETSGEFEPVISMIEMFQEPDNTIYQHLSEIGQVSSDQGYIRWTRIGGVIPDILQPPIGGTRQLVLILRLVDTDDMPVIQHGFEDPDHTRSLWHTSFKFEFTFNEKGYEEAAEHRDHARGLSVKIGMAVAMADGTLYESEGKTLKEWILKTISPYGDEKRENLKALYNSAMKDAHSLAKSGDLSLSDLTEELNEIAEKSTKYEAVQLCFDVMAADGVADAEELKVINKVADALELDFDEIEKMRDQKIIDLGTGLDSQASIEEIIGIEADWSSDEIKRHLRTEFQKWNNRLNTLSEGEERDNAQQMLDLIADARKKYG